MDPLIGVLDLFFLSEKILHLKKQNKNESQPVLLKAV